MRSLSLSSRRNGAAVLILGLLALVVLFSIVGARLEAQEPAASGKSEMPSSERNTLYICIAVMVAAASVSAAYAVGKVGAAAIGAASEKPELLGRSLIFVGLAEGIAIYGLLMSILLFGKV